MKPEILFAINLCLNLQFPMFEDELDVDSGVSLSTSIEDESNDKINYTSMKSKLS